MSPTANNLICVKLEQLFNQVLKAAHEVRHGNDWYDLLNYSSSTMRTYTRFVLKFAGSSV
jgi:predicted nucleotidyltransferase component of viral defense system